MKHENGKVLFIMTIHSPLTALGGGPATVLRKLLYHFNDEEVVVISPKPNPGKRHHMRLSTSYRMINVPPREGYRLETFLKPLRFLIGLLMGFLAIRTHKPKVIVAVYVDEISLLMGYALARVTGLPLVAYFLDLYADEILYPHSKQWFWNKILAKWLEPRVFKYASGIAVLTEGMAAYYKKKYATNVKVIPCCINTTIPEPQPIPPSGHPYIIGYCGTINEARMDLMQQLVNVIRDNQEYELRLFSAHSQAYLETHKLSAGNVRLETVDEESRLIDSLSVCDVLYLPVSFKAWSGSYAHLSTCFGTKTYQYLISRVPIVLQCREDYYMARFFRENECGVVVTCPDIDGTIDAFGRLRSDMHFRNRLVRNALIASKQFAGKKVSEEYRKLLNEAMINTANSVDNAVNNHP